MKSIYRQYFEPIEEVTDKLKCAVEVKGKKCSEKISSKKAWNLQQHLQVSHKDFYTTIQANPKSSRPSNQPTLDSYAVTTPGKSYGPMRDLLMFYATSTAAINDLTNKHLQKLLNRIPSFTAPSGRKLKKELAEMLDNSLKRVVETYLTGDSCFSLGLDIATTRGMKNSYLGFVATFFDNNDRLQRLALDLRRLTGKHDAVLIRKETGDALQYWGLSFENIIITVTDGARSIKAAFKELFEDKVDVGVDEVGDQIDVASGSEDDRSDSDDSDDSDISEIDLDDFDDEPDFEFQFPKNTVCAAHTLQLTLKDVFENCSQLKALKQKVTGILGSINSSTIAASYIREKSGKSVIVPISTRWSSLAICYGRLVEIFDVVNEACKKCKFGTFSAEDKSKMAAILRFVQPFKVLTDRFQAESEPTLSLIYPGILALIESLQSEADFPEVRGALVACLKDRFGYAIKTDEDFDPKYLVGAALDPNTARSLDFTGLQLSGFVVEMYGKLVNDVPIQDSAAMVDEDPLFSFGPATKKRRPSPGEEQRQSVGEEFLNFYEQVSKKRSKFGDFWALYKKSVKETAHRHSKHRIGRTPLFAARYSYERPQDELESQFDPHSCSRNLQSGLFVRMFTFDCC